MSAMDIARRRIAALNGEQFTADLLKPLNNASQILHRLKENGEITIVGHVRRKGIKQQTLFREREILNMDVLPNLCDVDNNYRKIFPHWYTIPDMTILGIRRNLIGL